ncbi:hypothetical protein C2845_PM05G08890 [Panicum miliaceum]|uniref:Uncharacterized protein n=1 Tax=Panicum miliaceum TaxID=4540 RepID=A0A3L6SXK1_PANMI|nr:hypothetical protein C2845_PM05G08890 [Panicum miliaceum]
MDQMSNVFWTNMVRGESDVPGLDDLNFPLTNETQQIDESATEVQGIDVEGRVEADLMEKEDKIMSMDMTLPSLTQTQLQYYQIMQAKIIAHCLSD